MFAPVLPPALSLSERLALTIDGLCRALAARGAKEHAVIPLIVLAWTRLRRLLARLEALSAKLQQGPLARAVRRRRALAEPARRAPAVRKPDLLPRGFGWLIRLAQETAVYGGHVQHLLDDPEMAALLAASPQAGRILRPLCRMLAIKPPPALRLPRRQRLAGTDGVRSAPGAAREGMGSVRPREPLGREAVRGGRAPRDRTAIDALDAPAAPPRQGGRKEAARGTTSRTTGGAERAWPRPILRLPWERAES